MKIAILVEGATETALKQVLLRNAAKIYQQLYSD